MIVAVIDSVVVCTTVLVCWTLLVTVFVDVGVSETVDIP